MDKMIPGKLAEVIKTASAGLSFLATLLTIGAMTAAFPPQADWNSLTSSKTAWNPVR